MEWTQNASRGNVDGGGGVDFLRGLGERTSKKRMSMICSGVPGLIRSIGKEKNTKEELGGQSLTTGPGERGRSTRGTQLGRPRANNVKCTYISVVVQPRKGKRWKEKLRNGPRKSSVDRGAKQGSVRKNRDGSPPRR